MDDVMWGLDEESDEEGSEEEKEKREERLDGQINAKHPLDALNEVGQNKYEDLQGLGFYRKLARNSWNIPTYRQEAKFLGSITTPTTGTYTLYVWVYKEEDDTRTPTMMQAKTDHKELTILQLNELFGLKHAHWYGLNGIPLERLKQAEINFSFTGIHQLYLGETPPSELPYMTYP
jgi:hypothetical protein